MYGMKRGLKYIKVSGQLVSRGEYETSIIDVRPYEAVTLIDEGGEELHFSLLHIPKRLDEHLDQGEKAIFYLLRHRSRENYVGALYAIEVGGKKIFYREIAIGLAKMLARSLSFRIQVMKNPPAFFAYCFFGVLAGSGIFLFTWYIVDLVLGRFLGGLAGCAAAAAWAVLLTYPLVRGNKYAGIAQLEQTMALEGFHSMAQPIGKY